MPFQPGHKKLGGNKKGGKHLRTKTVLEIFESNGINPAEKLAEILAKEKDQKFLANLLVKVLDYCYPKMRALEITGDPANPIAITSEYAKKLWEMKKSEEELE